MWDSAFSLPEGSIPDAAESIRADQCASFCGVCQLNSHPLDSSVLQRRRHRFSLSNHVGSKSSIQLLCILQPSLREESHHRLSGVSMRNSHRVIDSRITVLHSRFCVQLIRVLSESRRVFAFVCYPDDDSFAAKIRSHWNQKHFIASGYESLSLCDVRHDPRQWRNTCDAI